MTYSFLLVPCHCGESRRKRTDVIVVLGKLGSGIEVSGFRCVVLEGMGLGGIVARL